MHEQVLLDFFLGRADAAALSRDLEDSIIMTGPNEAGVRIVDLQAGNHVVTSGQLLQVCDAVAAGILDPWKLEAIGFCLVASEHFEWDRSTMDGARVAETLGNWSAPQVNYPLTMGNVAKARHFLATGEDTFTSEDLADKPPRAWNVGRVSKVFQQRP
jgi:hypothetical protein